MQVASEGASSAPRVLDCEVMLPSVLLCGLAVLSCGWSPPSGSKSKKPVSWLCEGCCCWGLVHSVGVRLVTLDPRQAAVRCACHPETLPCGASECAATICTNKQYLYYGSHGAVPGHTEHGCHSQLTTTADLSSNFHFQRAPVSMRAAQPYLFHAIETTQASLWGATDQC